MSDELILRSFALVWFAFQTGHSFFATGLVDNTESSKKALGEALDLMQLTGPAVAEEEASKTPKPPKRELTEEEIEKKKQKAEAPNIFCFIVCFVC